MDDLERELKTCFLDEAGQLLDDCEKCFLDLEQERDNVEIIEKIFRLAHNLKGTGRSVGFGHIAEFTHELESLLTKIKKKELAITDGVVSILLECNDHLRFMIGVLRKNLDATIDHGPLLDKIKNLIAQKKYRRFPQRFRPRHPRQSRSSPKNRRTLKAFQRPRLRLRLNRDRLTASKRL